MPGLLGCLRWLDSCRPALVVASCLILIACIGIIGFFTGPFMSTSLLYLIPLLVLTRSVGLWAGIACALAASMLWLLSDVQMLNQLGMSHPVTPYWNAMMRLGTFLVAISLVSATKSLNAHLEGRVIERTAALESQIAETRELEKAILEISDRERASLGQDLHDGLCQTLVGAAFSANMLLESISKEPPGTVIHAVRVANLIDDSITQARNLARGLYPVRLETEGLEMAIRELATTMSQRFGMPCEVECDCPLPPLREGDGIQLYRIIQEAVANAMRHAEASHVVIQLGNEVGGMVAQVQDDGRGIGDSHDNPSGMGLSIMKYRARMMDADLCIRSRTPKGTSVRCLIPIR